MFVAVAGLILLNENLAPTAVVAASCLDDRRVRGVDADRCAQAEDGILSVTVRSD